MNPPNVVFYGIGSSYVHEMDEVARRSGVEVVAYIDNRQPPEDCPGLSPVFAAGDCAEVPRDIPVILPLITPGHRLRLAREIEALGFLRHGSLVDATAIIASTARFGIGFQVNAAVVVGANCRFGEHVLVNRSASIGHDAVVGDYVSFGPGCLLCGSCRIDPGAFIGGGATIAPGVRVGRNAVVGAGAVAVRDVPPHSIVAGNPARVIRENIAGYNDVGV